MLYVGIDMAKNKHDLACISDIGQVLMKHFRFANSHHGFSELKDKLYQLSPITTDIHIALESTGHYNYNLSTFLRNLGYTVFHYNPQTKTDIKDALLIARKLRSDETPERYQNDERMNELKELTRYQNRLIQDRSKNKNLYVRLLDIVFPELHSVVGDLHNNYVYELLTQYPTPAKIKRARLSSLLNISYLTADKAKNIQEAAVLTIGNLHQL